MENSAELNSGVIRAAGALLWRKSAHGDQVLVRKVSCSSLVRARLSWRTVLARR